jgi:putative transposase
LKSTKSKILAHESGKKIIDSQRWTHIPHNAIYKVLLDHFLAKNCNKSKRRKPWIRYERDHGLSIVHLDWYKSNHGTKKVYVCVVLDDSSRCILAGGEFDAETTDNALL